jgi:hypothetical protein
VKKTAKEAWDSMKRMRGSDERVKAANVQRLMKEFELLSFRDVETVVNFTVHVDCLDARLIDHGEVLGDSRVVRKVLRAVPKRLKKVAVSIEIHNDLNTMTQLVEQLQVAEDADAEDEPAAKGGGSEQLLLTKGQWEARSRQRGGGGRHGGGGHGGDRGDDGGGGSSTGSRRGEAATAASAWAHGEGLPEEEGEGLARRRRRGGDAPVKLRLRHVVFRGRLLGIKHAMAASRACACVSRLCVWAPAGKLRRGPASGAQEVSAPPPCVV